ncbi:autophagy protein 16, interacts with Atg12p-Atg5p [Maudiozyma exigua]|uniref:Autophagy protein 16, interacts with Atg12p-Atg5p n=1 Tax=Maudiozyma exigua TaxID=34358 RepID=A0A9P6W1M3_MAUEX|nr:autophagy protein 16, interacts with Atg12p-Atg5p [Kazachstania exigua]
MQQKDSELAVLAEKLTERDAKHNQYAELFEVIKPNDIIHGGESIDKENVTIIDTLKSENNDKEHNIEDLKERIEVMTKNVERLNDELISTNIENNVLQDKFDNLNEEYNKLVQRWLRKVQKEADEMNENVENLK